jgi:two-component system chemotaxis sensor kinase CheA
MARGLNPLSLLNELRGLGACVVTAVTETIPTLDRIQADSLYFSWDIRLTTDGGIDAIKDVFIFVDDDAEIAIEPDAASDSDDVLQAPRPQVHQQLAVQPGSVLPSKEAKDAPAGRTPAKESTVRVPASKLDRLVNLVGELVMNQSRLTQAASQVSAPGLAEPVEEIERLVSELRDSVLGIRMMPIGATFGKFKRLVHDLSGELGKEIDLVTEGADTELDKTVLDQIGDPLVHLIRNSIDHGIETVAERVQNGKSQRGRLLLSALHTGSNVAITIEDDGKGLNKDRILSKAVEKGLVQADAALSDKDIFNLIFLPGFSTAQQITNISGRGVGMDVVKRQIEQLRGTIEVASEPGKGTRIVLTLPLTLAIIDGLLVEIEREQYIIPMSIVTENVELHRADRLRGNGRNVIPVRGELIPYVQLREVFHFSGLQPEIEKIVIVSQEGQRVGLVVDRVIGSHQTVIQSLGRFYGNIGMFSGATIMGDGRVALILDSAGLIRHVDEAHRLRLAS